MLDKIKNITQNKAFHVCIIIIIISILLFIMGITVLKYNVEGETNMPFKLSKITVISTCEGVDKEGKNRWNFDINQNNDIYLYINKNKNYQTQEAIKSIKIENVNIEKNNEKGEIKLYRPNISETGGNFKNSKENLINEIEYIGELESDLKNLKISNQEGIVAFRCANNKIGEYFSDEEIINHNELLKKAKISEDILQIKLSFDLTMLLESGREYKANIILDLPNSGVVEKGTSSKEITDLKDIIFKRTKN